MKALSLGWLVVLFGLAACSDPLSPPAEYRVIVVSDPQPWIAFTCFYRVDIDGVADSTELPAQATDTLHLLLPSAGRYFVRRSFRWDAQMTHESVPVSEQRTDTSMVELPGDLIVGCPT